MTLSVAPADVVRAVVVVSVESGAIHSGLARTDVTRNMPCYLRSPIHSVVQASYVGSDGFQH
jgi:hypothetical protein